MSIGTPLGRKAELLLPAVYCFQKDLRRQSNGGERSCNIGILEAREKRFVDLRTKVVLQVGLTVMRDQGWQRPGWSIYFDHFLKFVDDFIFSNKWIWIGQMISCEIVNIIEFLKRGNDDPCNDDLQMIEPRRFESFADWVQWFTLVCSKGQKIHFRLFPAVIGNWMDILISSEYRVCENGPSHLRQAGPKVVA